MTARACALTIAGSDSGGGAGIQGDLKTFEAFGVYGCSAVTAVTAQNSRGIVALEPVSSALVRAQITAVLEDFPVAAAKTGMLATRATVDAVLESLLEHPDLALVLDPVVAASDGTPLLDDSALELVRTRLLGRACCVTPNLAEAAALTGYPVEDVQQMRRAGATLIAAGAGAALVTGGHLEGDPVDVLCLQHATRELAGSRVDTRHTHGTGCTLSAAITAGLALGLDLEMAVHRARAYLRRALGAAPGLGAGRGPLWHGVDASDPD